MAKNEKILEAPRVDGFKIFVKLKGNFKEIETKIKRLSFTEVVPEKNGINATYIESRDINKNPYSFAIIKFGKTSIELLFTITPGLSPKKRKIDMVRFMLNVLTTLGSTYEVEPPVLYQLMDAALKDMNDYLGMDYQKLYSTYDTVKKDYTSLVIRLKRLGAEIDSIKRENYALKTKNEELAIKLEELETVSDETLKEKVQVWISEHGGEINITEFSRFYKVPENRIEKALNLLVREGFIQPTQ
ncbi:hypothetical protein KJ780_00470 [Candidatus Micrarchaeota archaeon]|nr:hypothetical protein [Candidatus Micrarchaeota archaeon]